MAPKHPSAPSRASSRVRAGAVRSGVIHVKVRHASQYSIVGNHLSQHEVLSATAIGLATHIGSLPDGARISIKRLAERFPESEARIAAALRELEAHGYLERTRVRLESGQVVTRTVFYNRPRFMGPEDPEDPEGPETVPYSSQDDDDHEPEPEPLPEPAPVAEPEPEPDPVPAPHTAEAPAVRVRQQAFDLLARLRLDDPRLLLPERAVRQLAPEVSRWLDRGAEPEAVRRLLAGGLPADLRSRRP